MNFSIGYYTNNKWNDSILDLISDFPQIDEVYFPLPHQPSGRVPLGHGDNFQNTEIQLWGDLKEIKNKGKRLTLLLNASCYGEKIISPSFVEFIKNEVKKYISEFGISCITTASPAIANMLKREFANAFEIRASVNMRVGNLDAFNYLKDCFDGYYVQRELHRNFGYLEEIRKWADKNNKKLYGLANSGCFAYCPWQTNHDNNVAHSIFVDHLPDNTPIPDCGNYLREKKDFLSVIKGTFIRPEDINQYKTIFDGVKLATRSHILPRIIVKAYTDGYFRGNLMDLLEPANTGFFKPTIIKNDLFPENWIKKTINCQRKCYSCNYCDKVLNLVINKENRVTNFNDYIK